MSMGRLLFPWDDRQNLAPLDTCDRCGYEIFIDSEAEADESGHVLCSECRVLLEVRQYE